MAIITVEIEVDVPKADILKEPSWFEYKEIVIDEAYLNRNNQDDSFYNFTLINIRD